MKWVDEILNKVMHSAEETSNDGTTIHVTFKGNGMLYGHDADEWERGHAAGLAFTLEHYGAKLRYDCPWPENWAAGHYGNGFAEGCIYGRGVVIYKHYPGLLTMSLRSDGRYDIEFKDGRKIISP